MADKKKKELPEQTMSIDLSKAFGAPTLPAGFMPKVTSAEDFLMSTKENPTPTATAPPKPYPTIKESANVEGRQIGGVTQISATSTPEERAAYEHELEIARIIAGGGREALSPEQFEERLRLRGNISPLREELAGKIANPPDLQPEAITGEMVGNKITELGLTPSGKIAEMIADAVEKSTGKRPETFTTEELAQTKLGKVIGGATLLTGGAIIGALGAAALPAVLKTATAAKVTGAVAGTSGTIKLAVAGLLVFTGVNKITDAQRADISNMRGAIAKIPGQSSTTLSAVATGGLTIEEGIENLRALSNSVDEAEAAIKQLGIYNLKYRTSDEYFAVMQEIKDARTNIIERLGGIDTILKSGKPQLSPEDLMVLLNEDI